MIECHSAVRCASRPWRSAAFATSVLLLVTLLAGCGRDEIRVYQIPKEDPWKLPAGWSERPAGAMRAARFIVKGREGRETDISIFPLKGLPTGRAEVINIWRSQLRLEPVEEDALTKLSEKVPVGRDQADLYDMASTEPLPDTGYKSRSLLATLKRDDTAWFFKMSGEDADVAAQKVNFLAFLKSLNLDMVPTATEQPKPRADAGDDTTAAPPAKPDWTVPLGWQETSPGQMLLAKFIITDGDAKADVNISALGGDGGGLLGNANRWRGQLGLEPVDEAGLKKLVGSLDLPDGQAILLEMNGTNKTTGQPAWFVVLIVPRQAETWFYRLMGDETIVAREKAALKKFVQSVKYPKG